MNFKVTNDILERVDSFVNVHGFECIEAQWDQKEEALTIYLDKISADDSTQDNGGSNGFAMEDCVFVNKLLCEVSLFDHKEAGEYELRVSSPGVERPLRRLIDFKRFLGSEIQVNVRKTHMNDLGLKGKSTFTGFLKAADSDNIRVETQAGEVFQFGLEMIERSCLVYNWDK